MSTNGENGIQETEIVETLSSHCVLIAGGGPVGLLLSVILASYGVKSVLLERNKTTTKWPKMDLTNARSMEMFRRLGIAEELRSKGVSSTISSTVLISSGLGNTGAITKWSHPSVDEYRSRIREQNDGTMPLEPYQRISQEIFEAWLKKICDENTLIDARFGWKVDAVEETHSGVIAIVTEIASGTKRIFKSTFAVGCDGASSQVRRSLKIPLDGGPIPGFVLLVHFKSRDLKRLQRQGQFWHIFFLGNDGLGGAIIAQDEIDTWTIHLPMALGANHEEIDSHEAIYRALGGLGEKFEIKVDEILVRSTYRPSIAVARHYSSPLGRIYIAGDAAHQNIPTGGYGMNMGLGDAFDLAWKLSSVINGTGGQRLLGSYEEDRRPVALMSIERSGAHMQTHLIGSAILQPNPLEVDADSEEGKRLRSAVHDHYQAHDGENKDLGVEMGYRYKSGICLPDDNASTEPEWSPASYKPTTWPGSRAPHVFLNDGSAIFDCLGKDFTIVEFVEGKDSHDRSADCLLGAAKAVGVRLSYLRLVGEHKARELWERRLVLVRPDGHVAWRSDKTVHQALADYIVGVVAGLIEPVGTNGHAARDSEKASTFSAVLNETQDSEYKLEKMGAFQQ